MPVSAAENVFVKTQTYDLILKSAISYKTISVWPEAFTLLVLYIRIVYKLRVFFGLQSFIQQNIFSFIEP